MLKGIPARTNQEAYKAWERDIAELLIERVDGFNCWHCHMPLTFEKHSQTYAYHAESGPIVIDIEKACPFCGFVMNEKDEQAYAVR